MKLFGIEPREEEFPWGVMQIVMLGEKGRGRIYTIVPFHAQYDPKAEDYEISKTKSGKPKIVRTGTPTEGYIAKISTLGDYVRGAHGELRLLKTNAPNVKIIASGLGAWGDAGRLGSWPEYLLTISPPFPVVFYVIPTRLKNYYLVFATNATYKVYREQLASFEETTGIVIPEGSENYQNIDKLLKESE
jgi:hypothetical protein